MFNSLGSAPQIHLLSSNGPVGTRHVVSSLFNAALRLTSRRFFVFLNAASAAQDQHSDVNDEDPEEEQDRELDSDEERLARAHLSQRPRRSVLGWAACPSSLSEPFVLWRLLTGRCDISQGRSQLERRLRE